MFVSTIDALPLPITVLSYGAIILLIAILVLLLQINAKLSLLTFKITKPSRPHSTATESEETDHQTDVSPGSLFETFLKEDPKRRLLSKKEQFTAYRNWRSEKGLNWNSSNS